MALQRTTREKERVRERNSVATKTSEREKHQREFNCSTAVHVKQKSETVEQRRKRVSGKYSYMHTARLWVHSTSRESGGKNSVTERRVVTQQEKVFTITPVPSGGTGRE